MSTICHPSPRLSRGAAGTVGGQGARGVRVRWARVAALLVAVAAMTWVLAGLTATTSAAEDPPAPPVAVVIQPGDTLWDLARTHAPAGMATLEYVALVEDLNDVRAGLLLPGHVLELPAG